MLKRVLPIFLLYILTSLASLSGVLYFYYQDSKTLIDESSFKTLRSISRECFRSFREFGEIEKIDGVLLNIYDIKNAKFIVKEYDINPDVLMQSLKAIKHPFSYKKGELVQIHHHKNPDYLFTIKNINYEESLKSLFYKILALFGFGSFFFSAVSYFIIKLSLKPIFAQINELNMFIKDTTHEIKTPLSVILMSLEMIDKNPKKYLLNIKTATKTISNLYDALISLNFDRKNRLKTLNLTGFIKSRVLYFEDLAGGRKFSLSLDEISVTTDELKFQTILDNLLSNSIKYSPENSEISLTLTKNELSIVNENSPLTKAQMGKIFDKFSRFDSSKGGFGIGLSLVKKYSDELDYKILATQSEKTIKFSLKFQEFHQI